jgi:hypothetical protein
MRTVRFASSRNKTTKNSNAGTDEFAVQRRQMKSVRFTGKYNGPLEENQITADRIRTRQAVERHKHNLEQIGMVYMAVRKNMIRNTPREILNDHATIWLLPRRMTKSLQIDQIARNNI